MKQITKIIVKFANKEEKLSCVTLAQEHTIWFVLILNWKKLQKADGHAHTVKEKVNNL